MPKTSFYDYKQSIAAVYTGTFAAMCSLSYFSNPFVDILALSFLLGFYFNTLSPYFRGVGGKLGSIGFVSSATFIVIKVLL